MKKAEAEPKPPTPLPPVERTAEGVRDALFDELNSLRAGEATTSHARAVANIARLIIESARLELHHIKQLKHVGESLKLGKGDAKSN